VSAVGDTHRAARRGLFKSTPTAIVMLILAVARLVQIPGIVHSRYSQPDFSDYYVCALAMRTGLDPYRIDLRPLGRSLHLDVGRMFSATYPPTFLAMFEPLTFMSPQISYRVWIGLTLLMLGGAMMLLLDDPAMAWQTKAAFIALAVCYVPLGRHFFFAQTQILLLLLFVFAARWLRDRREVAAGAMLAIAALLKLFPLLMGAYILLSGRRRALTSMVVCLAAGALVTFLAIGVDRSLSFRAAIPFLTSDYFMNLPENVSLSAVLPRIFTFTFRSDGLFARGAEAVFVWGVKLAIVGVAARLTLRSTEHADAGTFSLWVVTAILLSPTAWDHYLVLLLMPFAIIATRADRGEPMGAALWLALGSYAVSDLAGVLAGAFQPADQSMLGLILRGASFPALILAWLSCYTLATDSLRDDGGRVTLRPASDELRATAHR
jgi:hypothetical protein